MTVFDPFSGPELEAVVSLTAPQAELLATAGDGELGACTGNNVVRMTVVGPLDIDALREAARRLVARHQSLRASFHVASRTMCIMRNVDIELGFDDLRRGDMDLRYLALAQIIRREAATPFNLRTGPLLRLQVVQMDDAAFEILMVTHQLAADHWSVDLLAHELSELYCPPGESPPPDLPPAGSWLDYVLWLQDPAIQRRRAENREYWIALLRNIGSTGALAGSVGLPPLRGYGASRSERRMDPAFMSSLAATAAAEKSTFYVFTLSCFVALLGRLTRSGRVCVGVPAAGQPDFGENRLSGACINTLPLVVDVTPDMTLRECLLRVRRSLYQAQGQVPFTYTEVLQELPGAVAGGRLPVITMLFNVDQERRELDFRGLVASYQIEPRCAEKFEVSVNFVHFGTNSIVQGTFNNDLFRPEDRSAFMRSYVAVLEQAVADPGVRIADLALEEGNLAGVAGPVYPAEEFLGARIARIRSAPDGMARQAFPDVEFALRQADAVMQEFGIRRSN